MKQQGERAIPRPDGPEEKAAHILNVVIVSLLGLAGAALGVWATYRLAVRAWIEQDILSAALPLVLAIGCIRVAASMVRFLMRRFRRARP